MLFLWFDQPLIEAWLAATASRAIRHGAEMKLVLLQVAREATIRNDMLSLIDISDSITINPPLPGQSITTPPFWLVTIVECSGDEGTRHQAEFRIVDENGEVVWGPVRPEPWDFNPDRRGRRFRFYAVSRIRVAIPRLSDLEIKLFIDGTELGDAPLYLDTPSSGPSLQFGLGGNSPNIH